MGKQASKCKPNNFTELAEQTEFLQEELMEWYKSFVTTYPNRALTIEDFKKIYGDYFPFGDATQFSQHVFRQLDTDGDGSIDFREFVVWLSVTISGTTEERLRRAFAMYDLDSNGFISREEMTEIVRSIYKMVGIVDESNSDRRVDEIFDKMDVDDDGRLSATEFIEGTKQDPAIMKLLQCDWEMRFIQNFHHTTSMPTLVGSKTPLTATMSAPVVQKTPLGKKTSLPMSVRTHVPLSERLSMPCSTPTANTSQFRPQAFRMKTSEET